MDLPEIVKNFFEMTQQMKPGLETVIEVGTMLKPVGSTIVKVIQKGKHLVTYFAAKRKIGTQALPDSANDSQLAGELAPYLGNVPIAEKDDVAVVVDISRRSLRDVERFLVSQNIDANLIVVTNDPLYSSQTKHLNEDSPEEWTEMVQEFNTAINNIKHDVGAVKLHIFLAVPLPIAFGMGSVWGTVDKARVYHWNSEKYKPVLNVDRNLRFPGSNTSTK